MLLPVSCPTCGVPGEAPCPSCRSELRLAPSVRPPPGLASCSALLAYDGLGRELVARLKYRNARGALPWLAAGMAALTSTWPVDVVTWVPTTVERRRDRGFDQGRLLAAAVARHRRLPCRRLLRRRPGLPQTGLSRRERLEGPVLEPARPSPRRVLLVDDVVTTGATVAAAARALHRGGAAEVHAVAAACRGQPVMTSPPSSRPGAGPMP